MSSFVSLLGSGGSYVPTIYTYPNQTNRATFLAANDGDDFDLQGGSCSGNDRRDKLVVINNSGSILKLYFGDTPGATYTANEHSLVIPGFTQAIVDAPAQYCQVVYDTAISAGEYVNLAAISKGTDVVF